MKPALSQPSPSLSREFTDGLGVRTVIAERGSELLELLSLNPEFIGVAAFEFALRERVSRLANFRHAYYARVRRVDRLDGGRALGIVSEHAVGARLSRILQVAERHALDLDVNAALCLIRQIVPAIAMLHHNARDVAHGVLAPERILVTPQARIVITDYVLGSAVEQLGFSREALWRELRVAVPLGAGHPKLDRRADVMQIGLVSLSLILGRPLPLDDLRNLPELLAAATETTVLGEREPISQPLRRWLTRTLQLDPRASFASAEEAQRGLEDVLSDEGGYVAAPVALEAFLLAYREHAVETDDIPDGSGQADSPSPEPTAAAGPVPATPIPSSVRAAIPAAVESEIEDVRPNLIPAPRQSRIEPPVFEIPAAVSPAPQPQPLPNPRSRRSMLERAALVVCVLVAIAEGAYIWMGHTAAAGSSTRSGVLTVESQPPGAAVVIDGRERGVTPLEISLSPGPHVVELRAGEQSRVLPLTIRGGVTHAQYVEMPAAAPAEPAVTASAALPIAAPAVPAPAPVTTPAATITQAVAPAPPSPPALGWVTVAAPYEMQVFSEGTLIGKSTDGRLSLPPGRHTLEIVNETLAYRSTRRVDVPVSGGRRIAIELPLGSISVNAQPWAEVWIDGERVGETPIGNLPISIGAHEVVFKHPEFGERRHAVSVTLAGPTRLSVNMKP